MWKIAIPLQVYDVYYISTKFGTIIQNMSQVHRALTV